MQTHTITLKARVFSDEETELIRELLDAYVGNSQNSEAHERLDMARAIASELEAA